MVVYRRAEAERRWMCMEVLVLGRPKLRLDLKLVLLAGVVQSIMSIGDVARLWLAGTT